MVFGRYFYQLAMSRTLATPPGPRQTRKFMLGDIVPTCVDPLSVDAGWSSLVACRLMARKSAIRG
jgi:hypothetical protein